MLAMPHWFHTTLSSKREVLQTQISGCRRKPAPAVQLLFLAADCGACERSKTFARRRLGGPGGGAGSRGGSVRRGEPRAALPRGTRR